MADKKKFNLYDFFIDRTAKKDAVGDLRDKPKNISTYFTMLGRNFNKLVGINIMYIISCFPVFFFLLAVNGIVSDRGVSPQSSLFGNYMGMLGVEGANPVMGALYSVHGVQVEVNIPGMVTYVMYGLSLLLLLTFGYANIGVTISLRNMVKCEPTFMWTDFKQTVKRNKFQAILVGALDIIIMALIVYGIIFYYTNATVLGGFINACCLGISIVIAVLYFFARMYLYPMLVTFNIKTWKLFKNSFIFAMISFKRNIMGLIGIAAILGLNYLILNLFMPVGIGLPFIITIGLVLFTMTYAAWPRIDEIMIKPYYNEDGTPKGA